MPLTAVTEGCGGEYAEGGHGGRCCVDAAAPAQRAPRALNRRHHGFFLEDFGAGVAAVVVGIAPVPERITAVARPVL